MIKFKCSVCHFGIEVPQKNHFEKCPRCKDTHFGSYYVSVNHLDIENNNIKGGNKMVKEEKVEKIKKERPASKTDTRIEFAKKIIAFRHSLTNDEKEDNKIHHQEWKIMHNK